MRSASKEWQRMLGLYVTFWVMQTSFRPTVIVGQRFKMALRPPRPSQGGIWSCSPSSNHSFRLPRNGITGIRIPPSATSMRRAHLQLLSPATFRSPRFSGRKEPGALQNQQVLNYFSLRALLEEQGGKRREVLPACGLAGSSLGFPALQSLYGKRGLGLRGTNAPARPTIHETTPASRFTWHPRASVRFVNPYFHWFGVE